MIIAKPAGMISDAANPGCLKQRGFTLLEVLVALAIIAIALAAALRATGIAASQTESLRDRLGATWVAQNRVALHRAMKDWPEVGGYDGEAQQGGMRFAWHEEVSNTPNPVFRRVAVTVFAAQKPAEVLATLVAYLVHEPNTSGVPGQPQNQPQPGSPANQPPGSDLGQQATPQPPAAPDMGGTGAGSTDANSTDAIPTGSESDAGGPSPAELKAQELRAKEQHEQY